MSITACPASFVSWNPEYIRIRAKNRMIAHTSHLTCCIEGKRDKGYCKEGVHEYNAIMSDVVLPSPFLRHSNEICSDNINVSWESVECALVSLYAGEFYLFAVKGFVVSLNSFCLCRCVTGYESENSIFNGISVHTVVGLGGTWIYYPYFFFCKIFFTLSFTFLYFLPLSRLSNASTAFSNFSRSRGVM